MNYCYIFLGASGSGKTTLASHLFSPQQKIISFTTRQKRSGEEDHRDYHFINHQLFQQMIDENQFAEYDCYSGNYYGVSTASLEEKLAVGDCYDVLTAEGYRNLHRLYSNQIIPVILSVSHDTLMQRLEQRGETFSERHKRMKLFACEQAELATIQESPKSLFIDANFPISHCMQQFQQQRTAMGLDTHG